MSTIIAGRFQEQAEIERAVEELQRAGFAQEHISSFFVNPPGQHDAYPIGGDHALSPGAKESDKGVTMGAVAGGAIGAATAPVLGPLGPVTGGLLGAHIGGLVGSMSQMKERGETGEGHDVENAAPIRKSGMMVAVSVLDDRQQDAVVRLLQSLGASDLERAEGTIENGDWSDFDPVAPPSLIGDGSEYRT